MKAVSSPGDYIGQGKVLSYDGKDLKVSGSDVLINIHVGGWDVQFAAPQGGKLAVGQYPEAKRYPFHDKSPGLNFSGQGRGANQVGGKFVIWELEIKDGKIDRLAVDFVHRAGSQRATSDRDDPL